MWFAHTMQCYSATKWNQVLIYAATWANFENTMLTKEV